jgi:hypothetical protein
MKNINILMDFKKQSCIIPPILTLRRSHKALCVQCKSITHTYDYIAYNREIASCFLCYKTNKNNQKTIIKSKKK